MFWNHRMMQRINDPGTTYEETAIYMVEVYYHTDGGILGWTEKEEVWGTSVEELKNTLTWMLEATEKPILIEADLLAQAEEAREAGRESLWPEDIITPEDRISLDEVLDSLGLEREDIETWEPQEITGMGGTFESWEYDGWEEDIPSWEDDGGRL